MSTIEKKKARLVVQGQGDPTEYGKADTYAAGLRHEDFCALLASLGISDPPL